jgi:triosephosphate isomerase
MQMRMLFAGNWKMNGVNGSLAEVRALKRALADEPARGDVIVCPPFTLVAGAAKAVEGSPIGVGGQDCHASASGAFTGDVSAEMLRDAGATAVIVGHSERRQYHGETNATVAAKVSAAHRAGLTAILCIGESDTEREAGHAVPTVMAQLEASMPADVGASDVAVAYEPVWAIGTGKTPKAADIQEMHDAIRALLKKRFGAVASATRILYGGSVKPENARDILSVANVNGALVGGASLKAADFLAIIRAAPRR